jgi:hypothetical protein
VISDCDLVTTQWSERNRMATYGDLDGCGGPAWDAQGTLPPHVRSAPVEPNHRPRRGRASQDSGAAPSAAGDGGVIPIIRGRGSARRVVTASSRFATGYPASPDGRGRFRLGLTPDEEDGRLCRVSLVFEYVDELVPADVRRGTHAYDEWFTAHRQSVWIGSLNFPTGALVTPTTLRSELERGLPGLARGAIVRSRRGEFASTPSPPTSLPAPNAIAGR